MSRGMNTRPEKKIDEYTAQAKASWGETSEYHEFERKSQARSKEEENALGQQMMAIFAEMGEHREPSRIVLVLKLRILFVIIRMLIRPVRQNSTAFLI